MPKIFNLKIIPNSSRNEIIKESENSWRVKLTASPTGGKANQALIKFLAKNLGITQSDIKIIKGLKSKNKMEGRESRKEKCSRGRSLYLPV